MSLSRPRIRRSGTPTATGSFSGVLVKVPIGTVPGTYRIRAVGRRSGRRAGANFAVHTNWAQYGYGPARTGYNPDENVLSASAVPRLALAWRFSTGNEVFSSPAVVNGVAYLGSLNGAVYALNAATGDPAVGVPHRRRRRILPGRGGRGGLCRVGRQPAVRAQRRHRRPAVDVPRLAAAPLSARPPCVNGTVYTVTGNGTVYALNAATGALRWRVKLRTEVDASLAVADGAVYVPGEPGELYALKAATGARLWHALLPGYAVSSPAVAGGVVYLGTDHTDVGDLLAFNAVTGKRVWDIQDSNGAVDAAPAVANGVVYWAASGSVYATDAATATNLWSFNLSPMEMPSDPAVADGVVYFGAGDGNVYALNAATGSQLWDFSTGSEIQSSPAVADGRVYIGSDNDYEYAFALPGSCRDQSR